jgi:hypothetical protein
VSQEAVELARAGYAAVNDAYRTGDWRPFRLHVERAFDADCVLEDGTEEGIFTEGEWTGRDGLIDFVMGQTEALDDMWVEAEEYIEVSDMRDGKGVRLQIFTNKAQALERVAPPRT